MDSSLVLMILSALVGVAFFITIWVVLARARRRDQPPPPR
jgi:hypothetical protein